MNIQVIWNSQQNRCTWDFFFIHDKSFFLFILIPIIFFHLWKERISFFLASCSYSFDSKKYKKICLPQCVSTTFHSSFRVFLLCTTLDSFIHSVIYEITLRRTCKKNLFFHFQDFVEGDEDKFEYKRRMKKKKEKKNIFWSMGFSQRE